MKRALSIITLLGVALFSTWVGLYWYLRAPVLKSSPEHLTSYSVGAEALKKHVQFLSALNPPRSYGNYSSTIEAERYISNEFKEMGYSVELQEVPLPEYSYNNIIVRYGDSSQGKPIVVVGAHYDVCDHLPGADDNASGVAGLLELARMLRVLKPALPFAVEMVAFALEEPPYFATEDMGSAIHAEHLKAKNISVKLMISIEMIGYYSEKSWSQFFPNPILYTIYPHKGDYIAAVARPNERREIQKFKSAFLTMSKTDIYSINAPTFVPGMDFSDHRNYWKYGWPALMLTDTAFYRNTNYHKKEDTADRLNYQKMKEVVEGLYAATVAFAQ
jgi:Zn-dependent M28 family amino/carboxypeptidase